MDRRKSRHWCAAALAAWLLFATPLVAQEPPAGDQTAATSADAAPTLSLTEVQAQLAAIEANSDIEAAVKDLLRPKYQQAIEALKQAEENRAKAAAYRDATTTAPQQVADLREQVKALPLIESAAKTAPDGSTADLQKENESQRAALDLLKKGLSKLTSDLAAIERRPLEITARLPEAQRELSQIRAQLAEFAADEASAGRVADRTVLQANESRLQSELEMLKQEQVSLSAREELLQAQHDLQARQIENDSAALKSRQELVNQRLAKEAEQVGSKADTSPQDLPAGDEEASKLATEVKGLAKEFEKVVSDLKEVSAVQEEVADRNQLLNDEYDSIRNQVELGGTGEAMAQLLIDVYERVLDPGASAFDLTGRVPTLDRTRLSAVRVQQKLRRQPDVKHQFDDRSSLAVDQLVDTRHEVLEKLSPQYRNLIRELTTLQGNQRQYLEKADEVRSYISEQLFWMRSSPPVDGEILSGLPDGLRWVSLPEHWKQFGSAVLSLSTEAPFSCLAVMLAVAALLLTRPRIIAALTQTGVEIRRISTDRYALTVQALLWTLLLAAPLPLALGFLWWAAERVVEADDWLRGLTIGLLWAAQITLVLGFLAAICRPGGLGIAHFHWTKEPLIRLRTAVFWFTVVYIPALLLTSSTLLGSEQHADTVGRLSFMLAHLGIAMIVWRLFGFRSSTLAPVDHEHSAKPISKSRYLCYALITAIPLVLVVMAWRGYLFTAAEISVGLLTTLGLILVGLTFYWMALRWFALKKRKLALEEAIQRRRARQEAEAEKGEEESGEVISVDAEDERELDLDSISEQTRHLLRLLFSLGVAVAVLSLWSETIPLITTLDKIPVAGELTLFGLGQAIVIVVVTWIAARDVPGLLELLVLRSKAVEAGTRYAISTMCQYILVAIGVFALFQVLHVDWTKFGWIAAALSVGLGFGLQEVVANFVCGLLLLFEQPIRVGDVVTVEGVTGTVTRIRMRATTITNWDRQELLVPNKSLITNSVLNWTLSAATNRIVITVGAAYGSDTQEARQILLDVAGDHPLILKDPAPIASFEGFGDSALTLVLRAYLPNLDNRLKAITELNAEIDKRFAEAGIEIPFPQRDLHLRGGWGSTADAGMHGIGEGRERFAE